MDYSPCFNTYNNISYRQRSQTLQPIRGSAFAELPSSKDFILNKYFTSQLNPNDADRANYANVPSAEPDGPLLIHQNHNHNHNLNLNHHRQHSNASRTHRQHLHYRSQSQHYYQATRQVPNDPNYYNVSNVGATTIIPARSRHPSPITCNEAPPAGLLRQHHHHHHHPLHHPHQHPLPHHLHHDHDRIAPLDYFTIMQVCNHLGEHLDAPPPTPSSRNYSIAGSRDGGLYKIAFPQNRFIKGHFTDPISGISLAPGKSVSVLGPSKDDRSKFTVCYKDQHIDMPHQLTHPPQPTTHWP